MEKDWSWLMNNRQNWNGDGGKFKNKDSFAQLAFLIFLICFVAFLVIK